MYRYSVDHVVTYSSDDLVLFRESPFACWMERLTLENPDHGIPPDRHTRPPRSPYRSQAAFAATLRANGRHFVQIDWDMDERKRRAATLEAMRSGLDFIVDGHLAVGPLSGPANLLMRTSGFSELGDYLYLPCDTQGDTGAHEIFRLCFLADLLHSVQGQLPSRMLMIRQGEDELSALDTDDHIHYYRAVKRRFMLAQKQFRKHRMPDPAESSHCGRWYDCANELLRQRLAQRQEREQEPEPHSHVDAEAPAMFASAPRRVAGAYRGAELYDLDSVAPHSVAPHSVAPRKPAAAASGLQVAGTLAEQARRLGDTARPAAAEPAGPGLQPLRYIGESGAPPEMLAGFEPAAAKAPPEGSAGGSAISLTPALVASASRREPGHGEGWVVASPTQTANNGPAPHPLDSPGFNISAHIRVAGRASPAGVTLETPSYEVEATEPERETPRQAPVPPFGDSLNTSDAFDL